MIPVALYPTFYPHQFVRILPSLRRDSAGDDVSAPQCCAFGRTPTLMSFDGSFMDASPLGQVPDKIHLVVVDLCAGKNTSVILRALQQCYPEPKTELHKLVHVTLGVENLEITGRAVKLLREGDAKGLGELMTEVRRHQSKQTIFISDFPLHPVTLKALNL